ncbi:hypothetical protein [Marinactinospora rubrisoli]|uniref:Uncharacterized protein n=1 Tax=Marinactinospora rubrisoli TaxID=2715399 RepID=A0ABW2KND5_9ACTN
MAEDLSNMFGTSGAQEAKEGFHKLPKRAEPSEPSPGVVQPTAPLHDPDPVPSFEDGFDDDWEVSEGAAEDDAFSVGIYLLPETARAITQMRRKKGKLNVDIALDAIDHVHRRGQLEKLLVQRRSGPRRPKDSLFPARRRHPRATRGQTRKLWSFQATQREIAVLDELVEKFGASSRSELVSVALEARYSPKRSPGS